MSNIDKDLIDISQFFPDLDTADNIKEAIRKNFVSRRKQMKLTQKELSLSSGVSYASLRRFETTGEISLSSLLDLAQKLNCLPEFRKLFPKRKPINLKEEFENE